MNGLDRCLCFRSEEWCPCLCSGDDPEDDSEEDGEEYLLRLFLCVRDECRRGNLFPDGGLGPRRDRTVQYNGFRDQGYQIPGLCQGLGTGFPKFLSGPGNPAFSGAGGPSRGRPPRSQRTSPCTPHRLRLLVCRRDASRIDDDASRACP